MRRKADQYDEWDNQADAEYDEYDDAGSAQYGMMPYEERGVSTTSGAPMPSLVGVSATVTNYGAPLLSYTRTMSRFYQSRKQTLSMGRLKCAICGDRIGGWAWLAPDGEGHAHDGCYDRLAWAWASVYADQQRMADRGDLE
ncbi:MAG TPA: hypothetical protein VKB76_08460 [Ktedonobacterales bacterium]|nr:hypothetical protein [Ktedonobacterales bacterium]